MATLCLSKFLIIATCALSTIIDTTFIAFTSVPAEVISGSTYNLTWDGGDGTSPVTITLREGDPANLAIISTLTSSATGGFYLWKVSTSIPSADDYALQITQGLTNINYSGRFSLFQGTVSSGPLAFSGSGPLPASTIGNSGTMTNGMTTGRGSPGSSTAVGQIKSLDLSTPTVSPTTAGGSESVPAALTPSDIGATPGASYSPSGGTGQLGTSKAFILAIIVAVLHLE